MQSNNSSTNLYARIYIFDYYPNATFQMVSKPLAYKPKVHVQEGEAFLAEMYWSKYETRLIRYANTNKRVLFFPQIRTKVKMGDRYQTIKVRTTKELAEGIIGIEYEPLH